MPILRQIRIVFEVPAVGVKGNQTCRFPKNFEGDVGGWGVLFVPEIDRPYGRSVNVFHPFTDINQMIVVNDRIRPTVQSFSGNDTARYLSISVFKAAADGLPVRVQPVCIQRNDVSLRPFGVECDAFADDEIGNFSFFQSGIGACRVIVPSVKGKMGICVDRYPWIIIRKSIALRIS